MRTQIRRGVFETNSSSVHSITICSEEEFNKWKDGELLFSRWDEEFIKPCVLSDADKERAKVRYETRRTGYMKKWDELTDELKEKSYRQYAKDNGIIDEDAETYDEYMHGRDLESFVEYYRSNSGDDIVAFGCYGYDG